MKPKTLVTVGLLAFVCVSAVVALLGDGPAKDADPNDPNAVPAEELIKIDSGVVVYYFHRTARCVTCNAIEAHTREVMDSLFAQPQADGTMQMLSVNYEAAVNEHFVKDFQLTSNSVVLVRLEEGKMTDWKNLDRIWELFGETAAFFTYIQSEIQAFSTGAS